MSDNSARVLIDDEHLNKLIVPAIHSIVGEEGFYRCERDLHHHLTSTLEYIVPLQLGNQRRLVGYEHPTSHKYKWKVGGKHKKAGNVDFCFFDHKGDDGNQRKNTALEINYDYRSKSKVEIDCIKLGDPRNFFRQGVYLAFGYKRNFRQSVVDGVAKAFVYLSKQSPGFQWPQSLCIFVVEHDDGDTRRLWRGTPESSQGSVGSIAWEMLCEKKITTAQGFTLDGNPDSLIDRSEAQAILQREFKKAGIPTDSKSAKRMFEGTKAKDGTNRCRLGKTPLWDHEIPKVEGKVKRSVYAIWLQRSLQDAMKSQKASVKGRSNQT